MNPEAQEISPQKALAEVVAAVPADIYQNKHDRRLPDPVQDLAR